MKFGQTARRLRFFSHCLVVLGSIGLSNVSATDVWSIDSGEIGRELSPRSYYGAAVANGMMGIVSSPEPFRSGQTLAYGGYDSIFPGSVSCLVRSINFLTLGFAIDDQPINERAQLEGFRQTLDFKRAALTTSFRYRNKATVRYTLRALRHLPHTGLMEVTVTAKQPLTIAVDSAFDTAATFEAPALVDMKSFERSVVMYGPAQWTAMMSAATARETEGGLLTTAAHAFVFDEAPKAAPAVTRKNGGLTFIRRLAQGETYRFALVGATVNAAHVRDPLSESERLTTAAQVQGIDSLIARHESEWEKLWQSRIAVEGDDELQRDINSMLYHLYSSVRQGSRYSIPPMGLTRARTGYVGHVFWDADTWMLPALVALHPQLALPLIEYRFDRLQAAKDNAIRNGYRGAQFPWESAASGEEDTWSTSVDGALEQHISAGVALGAWNYYRVTQDRKWLRERGWPILKETADFWASRVARNGPGRYDINHVVGADEYVKNVDNDAYTNAAARENLAAAIAAAKVLKLKPDPDWAHVRANIPTLRFPDGVTRQHSTYNGERIKQADVNLLAHPLGEITAPEAIRRDLDYYVSRNDDAHGPSYSKAVFVVLHHRLKRTEQAYQAFKAMYEPNLRPPFRTIAENAEHTNPYMVTGAASAMHALLYGFGGLEITDRGLVQNPTQLPARWKSLSMIGIGPEERTFTVTGETRRD